MDRRYHIDTFERLLKERSDEFRMYPSRRIWYGIYNNIHPGKRWPSATISMMLLVLFFMIGFLNDRNSKNSVTIIAAINNYAAVNQKVPAIINPTVAFTKTTLKANKILNDFAPDKKNIVQVAKNFLYVNTNSTATSLYGVTNPDKIVTAGKIVDMPLAKNNSTITTGLPTSTTGIFYINYNPAISFKDNNSSKTISSLSVDEKAWIENYALHNKVTNRWSNRLAWSIYATPSIVYRRLSGNSLGSNTNSSAADINNAVRQKPAVGLETGAGLLYSISKRIKLKAALQFNYTQYNVEAFSNNHPVTTTLTLNDFNTGNTYTEPATTPFSNTNGISPTTLYNETYQISLPLGMELKLAGRDDGLQWSIGTTLQPTYITSGNAYVLSSDKQSYVKDASFINNWNLNAGFETFISYKTSNGYTWQIGPQFRYQFFSTYNRSYTIDENLTNYGIKIGISKTLY